MEHNDNYWNDRIPREIYSIIFSHLSSIELFRCALVCKSWFAALEDPFIWKKLAVSEFDLAYDFENEQDWMKLIKKYAKINHNIRHERAVVTSLAVKKADHMRIYPGHTSANNNLAVMNWIRKGGSGSGEFDYSAESVIIDVNTRKVEIILPEKDNNLVVYNDHIAQMQWNGYHVKLSYNASNLAEFHQNRLVNKTALPTAQTKEIVANEDPSKSHLIALVDPLFDSANNRPIRFTRQKNSIKYLVIRAELHLVIFDMTQGKEIARRIIADFGDTGYLYLHKSNVLFQGDKIYFLQTHGGTILHTFDITKEGEHLKMEMNLPHYPYLSGKGKNILFGQARQMIWSYDLARKKSKQNFLERNQEYTAMTMHCGLIAVASYSPNTIAFLDPFGPGDELTIVSIMNIDGNGFKFIKSLKDGRLIDGGIYRSLKIIDFEHVNHECTVGILNGEHVKDMKFQVIKAHQLVETAYKMMGVFTSRYFLMTDKERFGVIYSLPRASAAVADKSAKLPLNLKALKSFKLEYNTPYLPFLIAKSNLSSVLSNAVEIEEVTGDLYGNVMFFYEEWDGSLWKLSTPSDWKTGLAVILSKHAHCMVQ